MCVHLATSVYLDTKILQTEIRLLENYDGVSKNELKNKCDAWIKWSSCCEGQNMFPNIIEAFIRFNTGNKSCP